MAGNVFEPFSLEGIQEGEFLEEINEELLQIQQRLEAFRNKYGAESRKASAKLTIEIDLVITEPNDGAYGLKSGMKTKLPNRLSSMSMGLAGESQDGRPAILVRGSGSDRDDPRQRKMFDRRGVMQDEDEIDGDE